LREARGKSTEETRLHFKMKICPGIDEICPWDKESLKGAKNTGQICLLFIRRDAEENFSLEGTRDGSMPSACPLGGRYDLLLSIENDSDLKKRDDLPMVTNLMNDRTRPHVFLVFFFR
jgi:hypothetical protein